MQSSNLNAMYPKGFKIGNSLGKPGMPDLQKKVSRDALRLLTENTRPEKVEKREYAEYAEYHEPASVRKI